MYVCIVCTVCTVCCIYAVSAYTHVVFSLFFTFLHCSSDEECPDKTQDLGDSPSVFTRLEAKRAELETVLGFDKFLELYQQIQVSSMVCCGGVVVCGVVVCGVAVWCGVVWCGVLWCDGVWCGVVCGVVCTYIPIILYERVVVPSKIHL